MWRDVLTLLPPCIIRPPQAIALSVKVSSEADGTEDREKPACRYCAFPPMAASHCFGGQINCPRRRRTPPRPLSSRVEIDQSIRGGQSDFIPAAFQSSVSSPHGCSGLRTISARVGTFLLAASVIPPDRPLRAQPATGPACPLLLVDSCAVHVSTDTKEDFSPKSRTYYT